MSLNPLKDIIQEATKSGVELPPGVPEMAEQLAQQAMAEMLAGAAMLRYQKAGRFAKFLMRRRTTIICWWLNHRDRWFDIRTGTITGPASFLRQFASKFLWPFRLLQVNAKLLGARAETAWLNQQLKAAARGYVNRMHIEPGDLLVFVTDRDGKMGHSFGQGMAALKNLQTYLSQAAGGTVGTLASANDTIKIAQLNDQARMFLRNQLDACDAGKKVPDYKLVPGYTSVGPIFPNLKR